MESPTVIPTDRPQSTDRWPELYRIWSTLELGYRKPRWERLVPELAALHATADLPRVPARFFARVFLSPIVSDPVRTHDRLRSLLRRALARFFASAEWPFIQDRLQLHPPTALSVLGAKRTAALWGLWLAGHFPNIGRLLLASSSEQSYANFRDIPFRQFVQYVPRFVLFRLTDNLRGAYQIIWIKHLAKGNNLRHAPHLPFPLSRRTTHWTTQAPRYSIFAEAILYGMIRTEGGTMADFRRLRHLCLPILRAPERREEIVRLLVRHPDRIDAEQFPRLLGYLAHRFQEEDRFSLAGRSLPALMRQMEAWYAHLQGQNLQQTARQQADLPKTWKPLDFRGYEEQEGDIVYEIIQLCSWLELAAESKELNHCAADYATACASGNTSIWSLRSYPTYMHITGKLRRLLTIELSAEGQILQARGAFNARPLYREEQLLKSWARKEGLSVKSY